MTLSPTLLIDRRMAELAAERLPFVRATVVRARRPTSGSPGDAALVLADGAMEGFVGGSCAEATVRRFGLEVLQSGQPVLLRISPDQVGDGGGGDPRRAGGVGARAAGGRGRGGGIALTKTKDRFKAVFAVDPICGMTVAALDSSIHIDIGEERHWFCCVGCKDAFEAEQLPAPAP